MCGASACLSSCRWGLPGTIWGVASHCDVRSSTERSLFHFVPCKLPPPAWVSVVPYYHYQFFFALLLPMLFFCSLVHTTHLIQERPTGFHQSPPRSPGTTHHRSSASHFTARAARGEMLFLPGAFCDVTGFCRLPLPSSSLASRPLQGHFIVSLFHYSTDLSAWVCNNCRLQRPLRACGRPPRRLSPLCCRALETACGPPVSPLLCTDTALVLSSCGLCIGPFPLLCIPRPWALACMALRLRRVMQQVAAATPSRATLSTSPASNAEALTEELWLTRHVVLNRPAKFNSLSQHFARFP
eukprot:EG_transcript_17135